MASALEEQVVLLRCVDQATFAVPASMALRSPRVAAAAAGQELVSGNGVATAVAYWAGRADAAARGADLAEFDAEFVRALSHDAAIDLVHAAYHLGDDALFGLF
ncbi:hypothetical protein BRADI_3g20916v3 [Brachypodium distachyon]|uniref:Uncharacterized protein n=1 Tax=Brachypodium distachyon TaxID=15368 RepID=A0A0Q3Q364_BRADI|nr:hypothetical protein BRADI_3g20916v3 [Brachypodium distachyon]